MSRNNSGGIRSRISNRCGQRLSSKRIFGHQEVKTDTVRTLRDLVDDEPIDYRYPLEQAACEVGEARNSRLDADESVVDGGR